MNLASHLRGLCVSIPLIQDFQHLSVYAENGKSNLSGFPYVRDLTGSDSDSSVRTGKQVAFFNKHSICTGPELSPELSKQVPEPGSELSKVVSNLSRGISVQGQNSFRGVPEPRAGYFPTPGRPGLNSSSPEILPREISGGAS